MNNLAYERTFSSAFSDISHMVQALGPFVTPGANGFAATAFPFSTASAAAPSAGSPTSPYKDLLQTDEPLALLIVLDPVAVVSGSPHSCGTLESRYLYRTSQRGSWIETLRQDLGVFFQIDFGPRPENGSYHSMSEESTKPQRADLQAAAARTDKDAMEGGGRFKSKRRRKVSYLTVNKIAYVDYKEINILRRFLNDRGKILPSRQTGNTAKQQRMIASAIRRAREMALIPFVVTEMGSDRRESRGPRERYNNDRGRYQEQNREQQNATTEQAAAAATAPAAAPAATPAAE